jgi:teichuronic acid biosynthesis glycosyltransferase TuaC
MPHHADRPTMSRSEPPQRSNPVRVATVTTFFPNSTDPSRTVFVKNLVKALSTLCDLDVVAPVPFAPAIRAVPSWYRRSRVGRLEHVDGIEVAHPRFLVIPKLDVLSGVAYFAGVLGTLWRLKRRHGPMLLHAHCAYPDGVGVALAARALRLPYVVTAHGSDINVYGERPMLRAQVRWALRGARAVVAVSQALLVKVDALTRPGASHLTHIPCAGFNPDVFHPRSRAQALEALGFAQQQRLVVFVGNLVPVKGVSFLIDAWQQLRNSGRLERDDRLVLVGEGPERATIERRVAAAGLAAEITLRGAVAQTDVSQWIAAARLLCLPSLSEGTPNVVVEALASGIPVVASRVGGVPELVRDDVNGRLVAPQRVGELAQALDTALSQDWDPAAIRRSVTHLTWSALAERNRDLFESIWLDVPSASAGAAA